MDLIIIGTPHHLIQLRELVCNGKLFLQNIILLYESSCFSVINEISDKLGISICYEFKSWTIQQYFRNKKLFRKYVKLLVCIGNKYPIDKIYTSQILSDYTGLAIRYFKKEVFVLDEGTASFLVAKKRSNWRWRFKRNCIDFIKFCIYGRSVFLPKQLTFLTKYDIVTHKDRVSKYLLKKIVDHRSKNEDIIFLMGTKLVESGIISNESYNFSLKVIRLKFLNKKILYYAHRGEEDYKREVVKSYGFDFIRSSIPMELLYPLLPAKPLAIISYLSPISDTISLTYENPPTVFYYRFKSADFLKNSEIYENIYSQYKQNPLMNEINEDSDTISCNM